MVRPHGTARATRPGTVGVLVRDLAMRLAAADVPQPRDEARDMIAVLLDVPRLWPSVHAEAPVPAVTEAAAHRAAARRAAGAPFAYAVGRASFRHLTLDVDERVLIPRQETELLPELILDLLDGPGGVAIDVGTGSGAIALSLATEGAFDAVIATDVSLDALEVARANALLLAGALRSPVHFAHGSGLAPLLGSQARVVVSNPPYIAFHEMTALPVSVRDWEPSVALCCGDEGLDVTAGIVRDAATILEAGGLLALEVDVRRAALVAERVAADGRYADVAVRLDLTGRERFVVARRTGR
ncbi:MAG: N5-glutamine methyltransferase family protein [Gemmatimonadaceae bacterium]